MSTSNGQSQVPPSGEYLGVHKTTQHIHLPTLKKGSFMICFRWHPPLLHDSENMVYQMSSSPHPVRPVCLSPVCCWMKLRRDRHRQARNYDKIEHGVVWGYLRVHGDSGTVPKKKRKGTTTLCNDFNMQGIVWPIISLSIQQS